MFQPTLATTPLQHKPAKLAVQLACSQSEIQEAQRLRYQIFAEEMGAKLASDGGLDIDHFDEFCEHLLVRDQNTGKVVGVYRLLTPEGARRAGGWYSASEFNIDRLTHILPHTVELGRACVHADYRSGGTITLLWSGLAQFMNRYGFEYMLGCGSVGMADGGHFAASLFRQLQAKHYAPSEYRAFPINPLPLEALRQDLETECPALIRGYMRAGAWICGEPSWDPDFNTADMPILLPMANINPKFARHFVK